MSSIDSLHSPQASGVEPNSHSEFKIQMDQFSQEDLMHLQKATSGSETLTPEDYEALATLVSAYHGPALNEFSSLKDLIRQHQSQPKSPESTTQLSQSLQAFENAILESKASSAQPVNTRSMESDLQVLRNVMERLSPNVATAMPQNSEREASTLGSDILSSFLSSSSPSQAASIVAPAASVPKDELSSMLTTMVDRLLVGDARFQNKGEVQMKLSDSVLPQTELKLWRGEGGQLHVEFITQSAEARELLAQRLPMLTARLNEQFASNPHAQPVNVNLNGGDGMPEDGRSRQRYEPPFTEEESLT